MKIIFWRDKKGFTLVEMLIVISIIGLLASFVLINMQASIKKAKISKAQTDIDAIYKAIMKMESDTERYPGANDIGTTTDFKTYLGGYIPGIGDDPWGRPYSYDGCPEPCISCGELECETGAWQTSICSGGPDGVITSRDVAPNGDDICIYFNGGKSW